MSIENYRRFSGIGFEDFRVMAQDKSLTRYEKIGFPDVYREGCEKRIFEDVQSKLKALSETNRIILDIGPGCSDLPNFIINQCVNKQHELILIDSKEMLDHLPEAKGVRKIPALYPNCPDLFDEYAGRVDAILVYSVIQYVFIESSLWDFIDLSLSLLAEGGEMLIGDIPNISMRKRFLSSQRGKQYHQKYASTTSFPEVKFNNIERHQIDDTVVFSILSRARMQGFDAYVLPQPTDLPMANRREDILIRRP
jgi:hypothetical protein